MKSDFTATPSRLLLRGALFAAILCLWFAPGTPSARGATEIISITNPAPITIFAGEVNSDPYPSTLDVSLPSTNFTRVTVSIFGIYEPGQEGNGGLDILLAGPEGTNPAVDLTLGAGLADQAVTNVSVTIDDNASGQFTASQALTNGTYKPSGNPDTANSFAPAPGQTTNMLAGFINTPPNGTWSLYVLYDDDNGGGAITNGWALNFYYTVVNPNATTLAAGGVDEADATLNGTMNAGGGPASWYFEYGTNTFYSNSTPLQVISTNVGSTQPVFANITGLLPATTYHYQLVGSNAAGTSFGGDQVFITSNTVVAQPTLSVAFSNGAPVLDLSGASGGDYVVQFALALSLNQPITWYTMTNVTLAGANVYLAISPAAKLAEFFRVVDAITNVPSPTLTSTISGGQLHLTLSGETNYTYAVEVTSNPLANTNWTCFTNIFLTNSPQLISPLPPATNIQFFRAVLP